MLSDGIMFLHVLTSIVTDGGISKRKMHLSSTCHRSQTPKKAKAEKWSKSEANCSLDSSLLGASLFSSQPVLWTPGPQAGPLHYRSMSLTQWLSDTADTAEIVLYLAMWATLKLLKLHPGTKDKAFRLEDHDDARQTPCRNHSEMANRCK